MTVGAKDMSYTSLLLSQCQLRND